MHFAIVKTYLALYSAALKPPKLISCEEDETVGLLPPEVSVSLMQRSFSMRKLLSGETEEEAENPLKAINWVWLEPY